MAQGSGIEWTESTWNPVTGCTKISPGCKHCYAERMARRLQAMGQANYAERGARERVARGRVEFVPGGGTCLGTGDARRRRGRVQETASGCGWRTRAARGEAAGRSVEGDRPTLTLVHKGTQHVALCNVPRSVRRDAQGAGGVVRAGVRTCPGRTLGARRPRADRPLLRRVRSSSERSMHRRALGCGSMVSRI